SGPQPVEDSYLRLYDDRGNLTAEDDDSGPGLNSFLDGFQATYTGVFYIEAASFSDLYSGGYTVSATEHGELPVFSYDAIADQLVNGYWQNYGGDWRAFDVTAERIISYSIAGLTAAGRVLAEAALQTWADVTGLLFERAAGSADITFDDASQGAYSSSSLSGNRIVSSTVNIGLDWLESYGTNFDGYSFQTYIHEIGHALGLGHSGNYNGTAQYPDDAHYANDSWQASIMSYFSQPENNYVDANFAYILTPMIGDIIAVQSLYGVTGSTRGNDTVYGYGATAGATFDPEAYAKPVAFTIYDTGGIDLLDASGSGANQRLDLRSESISNCFGYTGNVCIARGVKIENGTGGTGNDIMIGNGAANNLAAGAGDDRLIGSGGSDLLRGGAGRDEIYGGAGDDRIYGGTGGDLLRGGEGADIFRYRSLADTLVEANGRDTIMDFAPGLDRIDLAAIDAKTGGGANDAFTFIGSAAFGGVQGQLRYGLSSADAVVTGDCNGDGAADFAIKLLGVASLSATDFLL
ncbi:MAG TPA: M10 family metallopeptidase, partial [Paracoccaceae bacterium]|nr:M10 family metallopeptidase [Paracoccaceae bacterium]